MPIAGIAWSWRSLVPADLELLLPFVMAADPSGTEALYWKRDAAAWLDARPTPRGIVGVQCMAGLTLALFFYTLPQPPGGARRLAVERLRWLELAGPHRSLDALLVILVETGRQFACDDILIPPHAATERTARQALDERAELAGFASSPAGWQQRL